MPNHYKGIPRRRQKLLSREWKLLNGAEEGTSLYSDGRDGKVTVVTGTVTLLRDMHYDNLDIEADSTVDTNGFRVFVRNFLTVKGTLGAIGGDASGSTGGVAISEQTLGDASNGATGGTGNGPAGTNNSNSLSSAAGDGGDSGGNTGGAGGIILSAPLNPIIRDIELAKGVISSGGTGADIDGGAGGGAGAGDGVNAGGGGGAGGQSTCVSARHIKVGGDGFIGSPGGAGGDGVAGNAAGGGGGSGGIVFTFCDTYSGPEPSAPGGAGGKGVGTGENGLQGGEGFIIKRIRDIY